jgi:hypothetical protein
VEAVEAVALAVNERASDAIVEVLCETIAQCRYFFALFNAVVAAERKGCTWLRRKLMGRFSGVYRRALELLEDPKLRMFAPVLALFPEDVPVPPELARFFEDSAGRITCVHEREVAHEW